LPQLIKVTTLKSVCLDELYYIENLDGSLDSNISPDCKIFVHLIDSLLEQKPEEQVSRNKEDTNHTRPLCDINDKTRQQKETHDVFNEVGVLSRIH
jgi:hypothetical protein